MKLKYILEFIDNLEREIGGFFWLLVALLGISFSSFNNIHEPNDLQVNTAPITVVSYGSTVPISPTGGGGQESSRKRKKFDLTLHRRLERTFPDWEDRMSYQKKQEKIYKSAMAKKREVKPFIIKNRPNLYTNLYTTEELNAIDYFHGRGIFEKYQDSKEKPNLYDTRQTLLLKMQDPRVRTKFFKTLYKL